MNTNGLFVLIVDKIYPKTSRFIEKVRRLADQRTELVVARVDGFGEGLDLASACSPTPAPRIISGDLKELARAIREITQGKISIAALNEAAILPGLALRKLLDVPGRPGLLEACDKRLTRSCLQKTSNRTDFATADPGAPPEPVFDAERFVVKPSFGASSKDVRFCCAWHQVRDLVVGPTRTLTWVPQHVMEALGRPEVRTDGWIVEPYIEGTEFSIDGWRKGDQFRAIVQHKLSMIEDGPFVGDGPTISPPAGPDELGPQWRPLHTSEPAIAAFGRAVLDAIGFTHGAFHIEGRERASDGQLYLVEINPRAPGGSLWRSALARTGDDLELVDAAIQLGLEVPPPIEARMPYVLHYPFYASTPGKLTDWGDLDGPATANIDTLSIDFAASLGQTFLPTDLNEEPYLAFAVACDETRAGLFDKMDRILRLRPPTIS